MLYYACMPKINVYIRPADVQLFEKWKKLLAEQRRSLSAAIAEVAEAAVDYPRFQVVKDVEEEAQRTDTVARDDSSKESNRRNRSATKRRGIVQTNSKRDGNRKEGATKGKA